MPSRWEDSEDGPVCLSCVRRAERAGSGAESRQGKLERARAASRDALARKREAADARVRAALLAESDAGGPEPPRRIAAEVGCGVSRVREIRREMADAGQIEFHDPEAEAKKRDRAILDFLRGCGEAASAQIKEAVGGSVSVRLRALKRRGEVVARPDPRATTGNALLYRVAD